MPRGKKQEFEVNEEVITPEIEKQAEIELEKEKQEDINENVKKIMERAKEEGGSVIVKLKKHNEVKAVNIGKFKANEFDEDLISKQYGGGTYYYVLRDEHGRIRAKWEEEYADPKQEKVVQPESNMFVQMSTIIKDLTKEISNIKTEISKPKENSEEKNMIVELIKENQKNQVEMFKALSSLNAKPQQPPTSMTEMLTAITTIMTLINKQQPQQPEQPKNNISDLVELAGLFADMKANGEPPKQETMMDVIKTFLTDGSLANVIAMLKAPKTPMIQAPQQQAQIQNQQPQQTAEQQQITNEKSIIQEFFKQYEKQLFQLKVDGGTAEYIANTIIPFFDLNNDFKKIGYNYFRDVESAYSGLIEVAVDFKNEQQLLKDIVINIHNYFGYNDSDTEQDSGGEQNAEN